MAGLCHVGTQPAPWRALQMRAFSSRSSECARGSSVGGTANGFGYGFSCDQAERRPRRARPCLRAEPFRRQSQFQLRRIRNMVVRDQAGCPVDVFISAARKRTDALEPNVSNEFVL